MTRKQTPCTNANHNWPFLDLVGAEHSTVSRFFGTTCSCGAMVIVPGNVAGKPDRKFCTILTESPAAIEYLHSSSSMLRRKNGPMNPESEDLS